MPNTELSIRHPSSGAAVEVSMKSLSRYESRVRVVKAMAHTTRMFIVDELSHTPERSVSELTEMVGADISTVSKHLSILKNAGIIADDKRGNQVYYRLRVPCILEFFHCIESVVGCKAEGKTKCVACE